MNDEVYQNMQRHDTFLSKFATLDREAIYANEQVDDIRTPYFKDIDRIIYSLSYIRYMNKTQVFSLNANDSCPIC